MPSYCADKDVHHCREYMPADVDTLHAAARILMLNPMSTVLGYQALVEALAGLRTIEALRLRMDAQPNEPGWITPDAKSLYVRRAKGQELVSPFVAINEGLRDALDALQRWRQQEFPNSVWYFPSPLDPNAPVNKDSLAQALRRIRPQLPLKIIPQGLRAFFVTVRRSHGILDSQIAWEIGHTSGGKTLSAVYGGVPPSWLDGDGPKMSWVPKGPPAWSVVPVPTNIIPFPGTFQIPASGSAAGVKP
jgi:hypothetical protein